MTSDFLSHLHSQASAHNGFLPSFVKKHVSDAIENVVESVPVLNNTRVENAALLSNVVSGEVTSIFQVHLRTPASDTNLATVSVLQEIIKENLPSRAELLSVVYVPESRAFKWCVQFAFDAAARKALEAEDAREEKAELAMRTRQETFTVDGGVGGGVGGGGMPEEAIPQPATKGKDSQLKKRRELEQLSKDTENELRRSRMRREVNAVTGGGGGGGAQLHERKRRNSPVQAATSVRPAKRIYVPKRNALPTSAIGKSTKKTKASLSSLKSISHAVAEADDDNNDKPRVEVPQIFSRSMPMINRVLCYLAGVEQIKDESQDYLFVDK